MRPFLEDGHRHTGGHGDPGSDFARVLDRALGAPDMQMLFEPYEGWLRLPAVFVRRADRGHGSLR